MKYNNGLFCLLIFLLVGCEGQPKLDAASICENNPTFCKGLNSDGWCVDQREAVVLSRYYLKQPEADEKQKYDALLNWEVYRGCIENAAALEFSKLKIRKTKRVVGYLTAIQEIEKLSEATKNSDNPYLLWYHWGRNNDRAALKKFIANQHLPDYNTPELQLNLATHYYNKDKAKTLRLLKNALSLYEPGEPVKRDIIDQLSSLYYQQADYSRSYIWSRVSELMGNESVNLDLLIRAGQLDEDKIDDLEDKADIVKALIDDAAYNPHAKPWL